MANKKITDLTKVTSVENTDLLLLETTNGTRAVSYGDLTRPITDADNNIPETTSIQDTDLFTIKNDSGTYSIGYAKLLEILSERIINKHEEQLNQ